MSYRSFEPAQSVAEGAAETGLLLLNHVGSSVSQDTGREAQFLADEFGVSVIAADRPGSGAWVPRRGMAGRLAANYVDAISDLGTQVAAEADAQGLKRLVAVGHSAGGLGALALTCTETAPITHVFAAEPVAWHELSFEEGRAHYYAYTHDQERLLQLSTIFPNIVRPDPPILGARAWLSREASLAPFFLTEQRHYKNVYLSDTARRCALHIAEHLPDIDTTIIFATLSLVAPTNMNILKELKEFRDLRPDGAPFDIRRTPAAEETVHASFDNRSFMAKQLGPVIARALSS